MLADILTEFGEVSGLKSDSLKSSLYLAGVTDFEAAEIENTMHFSKVSFPLFALEID